MRALPPFDETIAWYDRSALVYAADTLGRNPLELRMAFMRRLPAGGAILDAGSGSGRDTRAFLDAGFDVDAFDASEELARLSSSLTGRRTQVALFETYVGPSAHYDGVWAFASLLHVREANLPDALARLFVTLKPGGWLFANFKIGQGERFDDLGRRYTDMTADRLGELFATLGGWAEVEIGAQLAAAAFGAPTGWVSVFARRTGG